MTPRSLIAEPLTRDAFAPFGHVLDADWPNQIPINGGKAMRYADLAPVELAGPSSRVQISIVKGTPYDFPLTLRLVERHPFGSQAFMPLSPNPFLVVVCADRDGTPGEPRAFLTHPGQGVSYPKNTWHAVLTPINEPQDFLVVDRAGDGSNLEEHVFAEPWEIHLPGMTS